MLNESHHPSLTLPNDVSTIPQLNAFVDEVCEEANVDLATTASINLAIEEAVVNVMNYAYPLGTEGQILIESWMDAHELAFVIIDGGKPFDPTKQAEANVSLPLEERPIGGLGIFLVRQIMDSVDYKRVDGKNVLTLRKLRSSSDGVE